MHELLAAKTRREAEAILANVGVEGAALAALLKHTAPARHKGRVERALQAAMEGAAKVLASARRADFDPATINGGDQAEESAVAHVAALLLALDILGVGGHADAEGASTERLRPFSGLGKGRKQASDGAAWSAAIQEAAGELIGRLGPYISLGPAGTDTEAILIVSDEAAWTVPVTALAEGVGGAQWCRALAWHGMQAALQGDHTPTQWARSGLRVSLVLSPLDEWADVYNAADQLHRRGQSAAYLGIAAEKAKEITREVGLAWERVSAFQADRDPASKEVARRATSDVEAGINTWAVTMTDAINALGPEDREELETERGRKLDEMYAELDRLRQAIEETEAASEAEPAA